MVQMIDRPAEQIELPDRPSGRSFFADSNNFYLENHDVLASSPALIYQAIGNVAHLTLYFDRQDLETVNWQLVYADQSGRKIVNLGVNADGEVSGWSADYDKTGRSISHNTLDPKSAMWAGNTVISFVNNSPVIKESIEGYAQQRQSAMDDLATFMEHKEEVVSVTKEHLSYGARIISERYDEDSQSYIANIVVRVDGKVYEKGLNKRQDRVNHSGFSPAALTPSPLATSSNPNFSTPTLFNELN